MRSSDPITPVSRRGFVRALGVAGAALATAPLLKAGARLTSEDGRERSLVVVHLAGGHDGLSTFVPCDDEAYHRARPTLALGRRKVLQLSESVWLNRAATDLARLYENGELAVVPNVGLSPASLSHYRATQQWMSGSAVDEVVTSRWTERCERRVVYVAGDFEAALAQIADRIESRGAGGIFHVTLEGFDTHFEQLSAHDAVISTFARGMAQFQRRLARCGATGRVLTVAFSEFGRALDENEFGGTHHDAQGQCYFIGGRVRGGMHGTVATLVEPRRVIATAATGWLGVPASPVSGDTTALLPVLL